MFERSLKKRQKMALVLRLLGPLHGRRCLLVTNGDNTGALNFHLRAAGGSWSWAEMEEARIEDIASLLGEPVAHARPSRLPYADGSFDRVVTIDVHEHLDDVEPLNAEVARVLVPGGNAILTTPSGNRLLPLAVVKRLLGMTPEVYGHRVQGYTIRELEEQARAAELVPRLRGAYSRFFTESIELGINFLYVKVLGKGSGAPRSAASESEGSAASAREGSAAPERAASTPSESEGIAPSSEEELRGVGWAYRLYGRIFPVLKAISWLDRLIPGRGGYAVAIAAEKPVTENGDG